MISTWFAALVVLTAVAVTYLLCVRPVMRGRGHRGPAGDPELARQLAELRQELRELGAEHPRDQPRVATDGHWSLG